MPPLFVQSFLLFACLLGCTPHDPSKSVPRKLPGMTERQLELTTENHQITLFISAPSGVHPIDDYREVNFELSGRGRHRAVFFQLPDKNSEDPYAIKPIDEWNVPVRWDDRTMLYVPGLHDESILAAMRYIIDNGFVDDAFENEDDIRLSERQ